MKPAPESRYGDYDHIIIPGIGDSKKGMTVGQAIESYGIGCTQTGAHNPIAYVRGVASCFPTEAELQAQRQVSDALGQEPDVITPTREAVVHAIATYGGKEAKAQVGAIGDVLKEANSSMTVEQALESYERGCARAGARSPADVAASYFPTEAEQRSGLVSGWGNYDGEPPVRNPFTNREAVRATLSQAEGNEVKAQIDAIGHLLREAKIVERLEAGTAGMVLAGPSFVIARQLDNNRGGRPTAAADIICVAIVAGSFPMLFGVLMPAVAAPAAVVVVPAVRLPCVLL